MKADPEVVTRSTTWGTKKVVNTVGRKLLKNLLLSCRIASNIKDFGE